jgi:glycosyltransferase involved in cell wall biosynthesis
MFVFPSIYEGFGLPILEAMQCGCPVIASNNSSIPEVAGDAALLFDANDYTELARLIDKLLQDENLRKSYIAKGFEQVKKFSWEKTVAQLLNVIESEYNNTNFKK